MTDANQNPLIYRTLDRLEQENAGLRQKLAQHEFRQLERDLTGSEPFRLDVTGPDHVAALPPLLPDPGGDLSLPVLPVPMGTVCAVDPGTSLPVIAVHDDGLKEARLAAALLGLLTTQYRRPFARLVFLCTGAEAIPLLGRYGFVVEWVGDAPPASLLDRLHRRYGVLQVRSLGTGAVIAERKDG